MAVYSRTYHGYTGERTASSRRFLVLARYNLARLTASRIMIGFLAACLFGPLVGLIYIYAYHNPAFTALLQFRNGLPPINGRFFFLFCMIQGGLAYLLTAVVAPGLITSDLANGALPLFLARPFSRFEYIAAKLSLLLALLSLITWIPGLALFGVESALSGSGWMTSNLYLAGGLFVGLAVWIVFTTLLGFALAALVRWKIAAGALILGVFFGSAGFATAMTAVLQTGSGTVFDLSQVIRSIWSSLLRYDAGIDLPPARAWMVVAIVSVLCAVVLARRIRAFEVVR